MITSKDVRNKRFEKAAFGYKQEEIDEFLSQLEAELDEMERERAEANNKIQILADKVREYIQLEDEAVRQHAEAMEKNRAEIAKEKEALIDARRQVAEFKKSLFDMYKAHLEMISSMPESYEEDDTTETAEDIANAVANSVNE